MLTASQHLANYDISIEVARDFIMNNLDNLQLVYDTCLEFGVNNDMIAEIVSSEFPEINGIEVSNYFNAHSLDGDALGFSTISITSDDTLESLNNTTRFLNQSTFGASLGEVNSLVGRSRSEWIKNEFNKDTTYNLPLFENYIEKYGSHSFAFWTNAITANDQLRQRMAFALSQIFVISDAVSDLLEDLPGAMGYYMDILTKNAFGNYRELIEEITYSPVMGHYLTYMGNQKADESGRKPDENYAREILQLFSIGLVELNMDGSEKTDVNGNAIETYTNNDIKGLAKVFTGLVLDEDKAIVNEELDEEDEDHYDIEPAWMSPMVIEEQLHSTVEKQFLDYTIPSNTNAQTSISLALDHIASHDNVAPFISRQLIQRFTTSNPSPEYVQRVAIAFQTGSVTLSDGSVIGDQQQGDFKALLAAILLDEEVLSSSDENSFGKIKEPIIRFTQWARAFELEAVAPQYSDMLFDTSEPGMLNQHPYRSPSVFNFYRPGYVAPKTLSGTYNMTVPELQITNATSIVGYANFMSHFIFGWGVLDEEEAQEYSNELEEEFSQNVDIELLTKNFKPDYSRELLMINEPEALIDHLDSLLCNGTLSDTVKNQIIQTISYIPTDNEEDSFYRIGYAIFMVMTSPGFLVQK